MALLLGTSGWSYDDWDGPVYPRGLAAGDRLRHYVVAFPTVEIDATFYRDPAPPIVHGWIAKARDAPGFEFSLKAPQRLTQEALARDTPDACAAMARDWADRVVAPLADADRLGAILFQLSPGILHDASTLRRIEAVLHELAPLPMAVEFRNPTWHDDEGTHLHPDALALLDAHDTAAVLVDGPPFPTIVEGRATHAFVRFHGRNADIWHRYTAPGGTLPDGRHDRYDYLYDRDELRPWAIRLADLAKAKKTVRAYFNNHYGGKAWMNARDMEALTRAAGAEVRAAQSAQRRLDV